MSVSISQALPYMEDDPNAYARAYAEKNNMSVEEAQEALREKYGEPGPEAYAKVCEDEGLFSQQNKEEKKDDKPFKLGDIPYFKEDFPGYTLVYASRHNLTPQEAADELLEKYGEPSEEVYENVLKDEHELFPDYEGLDIDVNAPYRGEDVDEYIVIYSERNNITHTQTREILAQKYGENCPDMNIRIYAEENGISLSQAREEIARLHDDDFNAIG